MAQNKARTFAATRITGWAKLEQVGISSEGGHARGISDGNESAAVNNEIAWRDARKQAALKSSCESTAMRGIVGKWVGIR